MGGGATVINNLCLLLKVFGIKLAVFHMLFYPPFNTQRVVKAKLMENSAK